VGGDAARPLAEARQPVPLTVTVKSDVLEAPGLGEPGADRNQQDVEPLGLDRPVAARALDPGERGDQRLEHGSGSSFGRGGAYRPRPPDRAHLISCVGPASRGGKHGRLLGRRAVNYVLYGPAELVWQLWHIRRLIAPGGPLNEGEPCPLRLLVAPNYPT
jgi:hypothetical protein